MLPDRFMILIKWGGGKDNKKKRKKKMKRKKEAISVEESEKATKNVNKLLEELGNIFRDQVLDDANKYGWEISRNEPRYSDEVSNEIKELIELLKISPDWLIRLACQILRSDGISIDRRVIFYKVEETATKFTFNHTMRPSGTILLLISSLRAFHNMNT